MHLPRPELPAAWPPARSSTGFDRRDTLSGLADLVDPVAMTKESVRAAAGLARVALGASEITPSKDPRFSDTAWSENPLYRRWAQAYLVWAQSVQRLADTPRMRADWRRRWRAGAAAEKIVDAAAPSNLLLGNPEALKRAFDTGGASVLRGMTNALEDLVSGAGMPATVDRRPFTVGETLAATPGAVIHREDLFELLEYRPSTGRVHAQPLMMIPPQVNKHYFLDLAPGRSLTEYIVGQGIHYFTVVWRNPGPEHGHWGIDDYVAAQLRAMDVVREVSRSEQIGILGACAGGLTVALMLGHLEATGDAEAVSSATFAISMVDSRYPNPMSAIATDRLMESVGEDVARGAVYDSERIARAFSWMRPNDLVFKYVVNNWLLGDDPPAFDILAWNDDGANLSSRFYAEMLDVYAHNRAATAGGLQVLGTPIDLGRVMCDNFVISGMKDHITPWMPGYMTSQLLGGSSEVVVTTTGHIQTMVNPPGKPRARYFAGPEPGPDPEAWLSQAAPHDASWWPRYADWLVARSGPLRDAPDRLGSYRHRPLAPAPGTYVVE
jgi:polyhydroxyalkanoate synthase